MATVIRENIGNLHDKLIVKLAKEDYMPSFEKALKNYGRNVNIPGFRKGNVPVGMIRKMYGQSVFVDEVLKSANQELENYLKSEKPEIFAQPVAMPSDAQNKFDMTQPEDFEFQFEIGLKPEVDITPIETKKGTITKYKVVVSDKMLDDEIEHLRRRAGKVENPETLENADDIVYADYIEVDADGNDKAGAEKVSDVVTLEKMPAKLQELLKGKKAEEVITFVPNDLLSSEELKDFAKDVLKLKEDDEALSHPYKLTLTKIGNLVPRDLNKEFFEEVFPGQDVKTEEDFRAKLKSELDKQMERYGKERLQNEIFEMLVHETPMELPAGFLKTWLQKGGEKPKSEEEVEKEFPSFDHQLRWTLISDKLVRDNNIEVSYDEVVNDIKAKVMGYFGMQNVEDAPWMDSYLQKMMKEEKTVDETYRRLLFDKLFDKLETVLDVKVQEISDEDFAKLPAPHHHH